MCAETVPACATNDPPWGHASNAAAKKPNSTTTAIATVKGVISRVFPLRATTVDGATTIASRTPNIDPPYLRRAEISSMKGPEMAARIQHGISRIRDQETGQEEYRRSQL
jgi:hypothetical protein